MANDIEIVVRGTNRSGGAMDAVRADAKKLGLDVQAASLRVEKATLAAAAAEAKFGKESLQARSAAVALAQAQHNAERAASKLAGTVDDGAKATVRASAGFGRVRASIGEIVPVATVGAAAIVGGAFKAANAASDLNETLSKSTVIFGQNAAQVEQWGQGAARAFGMSQQEAISNASSLGDMFKQMGIGLSTSTQMSEKLVELSGDLASFHNADPTDVIEATTAAFRGEYDSVQRFVPTINAAAVETEALAQTHKKSASELTNAEKAQAAYALILKGTTAAQGDFGRTAGGAANSARILAAESKDAAAHVGQQFLPALKGVLTAGHAVVGVLDGMVTGFAKLPTDVKAGAVGMVALTVAVKAYSHFLPEIQAGTQRFKDIISHITPASIAAGGALGIAAVAVGALITKMEAGKQRAQDFVDTLLKTAESGTAADQLQVVSKALADNTSASSLNNEEKLRLIVTANELKQKVADEGRAVAVAGKQTEPYTINTGEAADAADRLKTAAQRLTEEMDKGINPRLDAAKASLEFKEALVSLGQAHKDNGASLSENTEKGRANRKALLDAIDAAKGAAEAEAGLGGSLEHNEGVLKNNIEKVRLAALAAGLNKTQVDALVASIYRMPRTREAQIRLEIAAAEKAAARIRSQISKVTGKRVDIQVTAGASIQRIQREINALTGKAVSIQVDRVGQGPRGYAHGGIIGAAGGGPRSGLTMAGEYGRELLDLAPGTHVYSNPDTERMLAGAGQGWGGGPIHIVLQIGSDTLGEVLLDPVRRVVRNVGGGDVQATFGRTS